MLRGQWPYPNHHSYQNKKNNLKSYIWSPHQNQHSYQNYNLKFYIYFGADNNRIQINTFVWEERDDVMILTSLLEFSLLIKNFSLTSRFGFTCFLILFSAKTSCQESWAGYSSSQKLLFKVNLRIRFHSRTWSFKYLCHIFLELSNKTRLLFLSWEVHSAI